MTSLNLIEFAPGMIRNDDLDSIDGSKHVGLAWADCFQIIVVDRESTPESGD